MLLLFILVVSVLNKYGQVKIGNIHQLHIQGVMNVKLHSLLDV